MNPFSFIYGLGVGGKNAIYDRGLRRAQCLQGPVVSVGNLSVGGSGKTPFILLLGGLLQARGITFDVLSRGYGRTSRGVAIVDSSGSARDFGDEPLLIARQLGVPVVIGRSRYHAGLRAEVEFGPQLHLLDDGFQHRQLTRDFDIVLITQRDVHDILLPVGRLREPLRSLDRADAVVLMDSLDVNLLPLKNQSVWRVQRSIALGAVPSRPVIFCCIARPERFLQQLVAAGVKPVASKFFPDHHSYTAGDINSLHKLRQQSNADGFITTEKDIVNLGELQSGLSPLAVARVTLNLADADNAVNTILRRIKERTPRT
ncbi:MAG: tetraacyldisaccharide 4'-kinase [Terriglobales bacterium]